MSEFLSWYLSCSVAKESLFISEIFKVIGGYENEKVSVPSLLLMIILVAFPQISETIYTPSLPDISKALHVSNNEVQLTLSVYFAGFALGVFLLDGYQI